MSSNSFSIGYPSAEIVLSQKSTSNEVAWDRVSLKLKSMDSFPDYNLRLVDFPRKASPDERNSLVRASGYFQARRIFRNPLHLVDLEKLFCRDNLFPNDLNEIA